MRLVDALLEVADLTVSAGDRPLVRGVSLRVDAGERVALLGASGSGKSLTADSVLGTLHPRLRRTGTVRLDGCDVTSAPPRERPGLAAVLQATASALNPVVRVGRQLRLVPDVTPEQVLDLLTDLGLEAQRVADSYPTELSGGQRQRACLALALLSRPRLIVADEPTSALDTVSQHDVVAAIDQQTSQTGAALLFITHDVALASRLCRRAVILHEGEVVADQPFLGLLDRPGHPAAAELVQAARACAWNVTGAAA